LVSVPSPFRRAVIVGASGGIGGALVEALAAAGCEVHALSRRGSPCAAARSSGIVDLSDEASIAAAAARIGSAGEIDLVVVASGLLHGPEGAPEKSFRSLSAPTLAAYFAVNATGPALVAKHFLPLLPRRGRAVFAALSARVGSIGDNRLGGWYGYRASKAALNMVIRTLAIEVARTRPEAVCLALHPGTVDTALSAPFQRGLSAEQLFTPKVAAAQLIAVMSGAGPDDSGFCLDWAGQRVPP
jgi:NAD(P)-dependent dehydrogenase (short-subunit alcohol dehydrogenase family)